MPSTPSLKPSRSLRVVSGIAIVFGAMTVFSGGRALVGVALALAAVGSAVGVVRWFTFWA